MRNRFGPFTRSIAACVLKYYVLALHYGLQFRKIMRYEVGIRIGRLHVGFQHAFCRVRFSVLSLYK